MAKRPDVIIRFGGDLSMLERAQAKIKASASSLGGFFDRTFGRIGALFGIGAGVAGGGIIAGIARMTQELDTLGKTAAGLRTTVEELSALRYAAGQTSELGDQGLDMVLQKLVKHIGRANQGGKESQKIFQELGLSWEYLASLDSGKAFLEVVDALNKMPSAYDQAAVAQKLFEDPWRKLIPLIQTGREGLEGLMEQQRAMGGPTTEAAQAAARLNDAIDRLNNSATGLAYQYGPPVIDFLAYLAEQITGPSGAENALQRLTREVVDLEDEIARLEGHGTWFDDLVNAVTTDAERAKVIKDLREELAKLREELDKEFVADYKRKQLKAKADKDVQMASAAATTTKRASTSGISASTSRSARDDWRKRSAEEIGSALNDFRAGVIGAEELGRRAGLQSPDYNPAAGAYGTAGNNALGTTPSSRILRVGIDREGLNEQFREYFKANQYTVYVNPMLVDENGAPVGPGTGGMQREADQRGTQQP